MKKYIIIVSLAVGALAYGQINIQSPSNPVINKENPFLDASGYNGLFPNSSIGKGLYFPTTDLKTWEFKTDLIDPETFSTYFDGMIVYNTGEGEPTTEASVGGIRKNLKRGFYYFKNPGQTFPDGSVANGEWVRLNDSFANDQEWKFNPTNQRIELVRSGKDTGLTNKVFYDTNTGQRISADILENIERSTITGFSGGYTYGTENISIADIASKNINLSLSKNLPLYTSPEGGKARGLESNIINLTADDDFGGSLRLRRDRVTVNNNNANDYGSIFTNSATLQLGGTGTIPTGIANTSYVLVSPTQNITSSVSGSYSAITTTGSRIQRAYGIDAAVKHSGTEGNEITESSAGNFLFRAIKNSFIKDVRGINNMIESSSQNPSKAKQMAGIYNRIEHKGKTKYGNIFGMISYLHVSDEAVKPSNLYGLYIDRVEGGEYGNYSIYTRTGKIRLGDLADDTTTEDRLVIANTEGILGTSATSISDLESLWANDTDNNLVKLKNLADGTTARTDTGDNRNSVTISDEGAITAKSFRGYNESEMFPDYVFENYYKGASAIKTNYTFKNLDQVESFVKTNGHLPGYQSAKEVKAQGYVDIMKTQLTNVEKIEELYLHLIEKEKEVQDLKKRVEKLEQLMNK